ncbi:MAG: hypothetical protein E7E92_05275 [Clostridiales bacterium]|nr:hypothetical protein [Alcaligenes faecalis]MDU2111913.1 hypothetical protein [Clostridiales bacterium]
MARPRGRVEKEARRYGGVEKTNIPIKDIVLNSNNFEIGCRYKFKMYSKIGKERDRNLFLNAGSEIVGTVIGKYPHFVRVKFTNTTECFSYLSFMLNEMGFKKIS